MGFARVCTVCLALQPQAWSMLLSARRLCHLRQPNLQSSRDRDNFAWTGKSSLDEEPPLLSPPSTSPVVLHPQLSVIMASARSLMRLGSGRSLATAVRSSRTFTTTALKATQASTAPISEDVPNMRQAQRPRMSNGTRIRPLIPQDVQY